MKKVILDIETDALNASVIHLAICKETVPNRYHIFGSPDGYSMETLPKYLMSADKIIMHNGISFDLPVINKLLNTKIPYSKVIDTLLLSYLHNPVIDNGHSLEAWGKRLDFPKLSHDDYSTYSPEMETYCKQDVDLTEKLYDHFMEQVSDFSKKSVELEHTVRRVIDIQQDNGFYLDQPKASILLAQLKDESGIIEDELVKEFEPTIKELKTKTKVIPFNPHSRQQIGDRLMKRGWEPKLFTEKTGFPVVNESTLDACEIPEAKHLLRYMMLRKRVVQIQSWIDLINPETNRVHGSVRSIGAVTGRMTHNNPNMAQVPSGASPYGKECRECWTVEDPTNYNLVGADASGLELRCLAHYIQDENYTKEILEGDIHTANQKMAGLYTRDQAKTFIYALLYGAGPYRIGSIVGSDATVGQHLITRFLNHMPKLARWREQVIEEAMGGDRVKAIDGRYLRIRSSHAAVNTLLQGAGAIICKEWLVHIMKMIKVAGLDAKPVANIHDEVQFEVHKDDTQVFKDITKKAMVETEHSLNVKCPLDSEAKEGKTWANTH